MRNRLAEPAVAMVSDLPQARRPPPNLETESEFSPAHPRPTMSHEESSRRANEPAVVVDGKEKTSVGNYFVANYPPFSFWQQDAVPDLERRLAQRPADDVPLGLYVHIPFCRKRCDFCYFRVYTDNNAERVRRYIDALLAEVEAWSKHPMIAGRRPEFIYFGGGTPSYLSVDQLKVLFEGLQQHLPWGDSVSELTFECEPGTLQEKKIKALRDLGVTRLSLGVENFNPEILELNNRAHRAAEIHRAYETARDVGFPQINIDLIAGMVGESEENWRACIDETRRLAPDAVTIYQMEIPYNTTIYRRMKDGGQEVAPVADWETKRRWVRQAFDALALDGYTFSSAYTAVKRSDNKFVYRDSLWHGADLLGLGVASFSHLGGIHFQNKHDYEPYVQTVEVGGLPVHRAYVTTAEERLIREFVLQLKTGSVERAYFRDKFGVDLLDRFAAPIRKHVADGMMEVDDASVRMTPDGLLVVDRLLYAFFLDAHVRSRYA